MNACLLQVSQYSMRTLDCVVSCLQSLYFGCHSIRARSETLLIHDVLTLRPTAGMTSRICFGPTLLTYFAYAIRFHLLKLQMHCNWSDQSSLYETCTYHHTFDQTNHRRYATSRKTYKYTCDATWETHMEIYSGSMGRIICTNVWNSSHAREHCRIVASWSWCVLISIVFILIPYPGFWSTVGCCCTRVAHVNGCRLTDMFASSPHMRATRFHSKWWHTCPCRLHCSVHPCRGMSLLFICSHRNMYTSLLLPHPPLHHSSFHLCTYIPLHGSIH